MIRLKDTARRWLIIVFFVSWTISNVRGESQKFNFLNSLNHFEGLLQDGGALFSTSMSKDGGEALQNLFKNGALDGIWHHFLELFRQGLIAANVTDLSIPDFAVELEGEYGHGIVHATNSKVVGLTDFEVKNFSSSATHLNMAIDVQFPVLEFRGIYKIDGKLAGLLPIWGGGSYSLKFAGLEASAGGHYKPPSLKQEDSIQIFDPFLTLGKVRIGTSGLVSQSELTELTLVGLATIVIYTVTVVLVTLFAQKIGTKIRERRLRGFTQIPQTSD